MGFFTDEQIKQLIRAISIPISDRKPFRRQCR